MLLRHRGGQYVLHRGHGVSYTSFASFAPPGTDGQDPMPRARARATLTRTLSIQVLHHRIIPAQARHTYIYAEIGPSILSPSVAASDTLVEGSHGLIRGADLQLLVVGSVVAASRTRSISLIRIFPRLSAAQHIVNALPTDEDVQFNLFLDAMNVRTCLAEEAHTVQVLRWHEGEKMCRSRSGCAAEAQRHLQLQHVPAMRAEMHRVGTLRAP
mmetsp:Transcript_35858/g.115283  ORF Transcript_35858/g.115283 Transcript_35858/m.115283 type:complete len:213 (-) Transcript_35858:88-726(-)